MKTAHEVFVQKTVYFRQLITLLATPNSTSPTQIYADYVARERLRAAIDALTWVLTGKGNTDNGNHDPEL